MNLYILVEGKQTERKLYPCWIELLTPNIQKVDFLSQLTNDKFYLISGEGYPRMIDVALINSLKDINEHKNITNFWVVMDSEGDDIVLKEQYVLDQIRKSGVDISHCQVDVIIQDPCIETWGLGNKVIISRNKISPHFAPFFSHYDVQSSDPELMKVPSDYEGSIAKYHESYLKGMLSLRNATYTKKNPAALMESTYLEQLISRASDSNQHLSSFRKFYELATKFS